jgi:hypothetical protein
MVDLMADGGRLPLVVRNYAATVLHQYVATALHRAATVLQQYCICAVIVLQKCCNSTATVLQ